MKNRARWSLCAKTAALLMLAILAVGVGPMTLSVFGLDNLTVCRNTHHYSLRQDAFFRPNGLISLMEPNSRLASYKLSWQGNDFRGVYKSILGSNQRAITSKKQLLDYLLLLGVIKVEVEPNSPYHFIPPWNSEKLAQLGIRYVMQTGRNDQALHDGWHLIGSDDDKYIYENPKQPSPVYLSAAKEMVFLHDFKISNNSIIIPLPKVTRTGILTATFLLDAATKVYVDGAPRKARASGSPFIQIPVLPNDHEVLIKFERFTWADILVWIVVSLVCLFAGYFWVRTT